MIYVILAATASKIIKFFFNHSFLVRSIFTIISKKKIFYDDNDIFPTNISSSFHILISILNMNSYGDK